MNKPTKNKIWKIEEMEADHITPWHLGGKTVDENCQMLCKTFNREKNLLLQCGDEKFRNHRAFFE